MKMTILAIGKKHDPKLEAAITDYTNRLSHYAKVEWKLLETKIKTSMNEAEIRTAESELILEHCRAEQVLVLLDERGNTVSSPQLAEKIQEYRNRSTKNIVFIIGGAYGVNEDLMKRADFIWSLSPLVFPHQLVRLLLSEQLYRAYSILNGEKYHHI